MSCASESCPESCDKWSEQSAKDIVQLGDSLDPISIFAINYQRTRSRVDLKRALDAALSRYVSCNLLTDDSLLRDINAEFIIIIITDDSAHQSHDQACMSSPSPVSRH